MKSINKILKEEIELIKVDDSGIKKIKTVAKEFCDDLRLKLRKKGIDAFVFIGGSLAKGTMIKKDIQDVDVFVRFDDKYGDREISVLLGKIIGGKGKKIHGSRDYYQVFVDNLVIEVIPVLKVSNPSKAVNVTDLSYFHVNYILRKIRLDKNLGDEIMLAKTFAHACDCYGAESYINGFSGYALELLICHYGSFLRFIKAVVKMKDNEREIIDDAGFYSSKGDVFSLLNHARLQSPIILIDPTFKDRNALAGLNKETFFKFKRYCYEFLSAPLHDFFKKHFVEEEFSKFKDVKVVEIKTSKQAGDIAGTKSKKFFRFFSRALTKEFLIKKSGFEYDDKNNVARFYFVLSPKKDEIIRGPLITDVKSLGRFKKVHSDVFIKNNLAYVKISHKKNFKEWFDGFVNKEKKVIKGMSISEILVNNT